MHLRREKEQKKKKPGIIGGGIKMNWDKRLRRAR